jgi:DNA-binding transcriptional MerR regulator
MSLRIAEVADAAGVNKETLRYYERRGLLQDPERSPGGHRRYGDRDIQTLRIIKVAQRLGFTLAEVAGLLEVGRRCGRTTGLRQVRRPSWPRSTPGSLTSRRSGPTSSPPSTPGARTFMSAPRAIAAPFRAWRSQTATATSETHR